MIDSIIDFSLRQRAFVMMGAVVIVAVGTWSAVNLPVDAVPDLTGVQVQINCEVPALAAEESELAVTRPLELEMQGLPGVEEVRSITKFGLAQVTMNFQDGTDIYRARQLVTERMQGVELPDGVVPKLAPISTGLGEILYYVVRWKSGATERPADSKEALMQLRETQEYVIKPMLRAVQGVAEINSNGGYQRQIVIEPDVERLSEASLTVADLADVIKANADNAGGGIIASNGEQLTIRAVSKAQSVDQFADLPVKFGAGVSPLRVKDLAKVHVGANYRVGAATYNGEECVLGTIMMLAGQNARVVCERVEPKMPEVQKKLPAGMEIHTVYARSDLVNSTIFTVKKNLFEGAALVVVVLLLLLGNWRAGLIVAMAIPLSFLLALTGMNHWGISGNLMSLGAVDFGLIIDGAVVMVENIVRQLGEAQHHLGRRLKQKERIAIVRRAAKQVGKPMVFGVLIITIVYLPILSLSGIEGKMFHPMAMTVILALVGALALSLTLMPVMCALFLGGDIAEKDNFFISAIKAVYRPMLRMALMMRWLVLAVAVALCFFGSWLYERLGAEFVPTLDEGAITSMVYKDVGMSLDKSLEMQLKAEAVVLHQFPEVKYVFNRIGTSEVATDPMAPNENDFYIFYHSPSQWPKTAGRPQTKAELCEQIERAINEAVPGHTFEFAQPIAMRFNEMLEGSKAALSLKIYGPDFDELERLARRAKEIIDRVPGGSADLEVDGRVTNLVLTVKRDQLLKRNLSAHEINHAVGVALGGETVGRLVEGNRRYDIVVRLPEHQRADESVIKALPIRVGENGMLPLGDVIDLARQKVVEPIAHEVGQRRIGLMLGVQGRDMEGFVNEAISALEKAMPMPAGYTFEFGGTFKNLREARERLMIIVPAALFLILLLIYLSFRSFRQMLIIATGIPLALVGGVVALWLRDMPFSITAAVGFIALSGVAVLNGLVMVSSFNDLLEEGNSLYDTVLYGALGRLRPVMMTAFVASLGFVPMAIATGPGAEVQRPLATVVIGGIMSSTLLTLILLPVLYRMAGHRSAKRSHNTIEHLTDAEAVAA
ncbi:MAG: efflux RND transporter permease subunit [Verrucomicrobiaceae bacterium]|nr:efflux RND transporter permease subunit [Verrucomicrobiaceae bacterium]